MDQKRTNKLSGENETACKSLLSFKNRSQAPGWITFGAEFIKANFQTEEFRFWQRLLN